MSETVTTKTLARELMSERDDLLCERLRLHAAEQKIQSRIDILEAQRAEAAERLLKTNPRLQNADRQEMLDELSSLNNQIAEYKAKIKSNGWKDKKERVESKVEICTDDLDVQLNKLDDENSELLRQEDLDRRAEIYLAESGKSITNRSHQNMLETIQFMQKYGENNCCDLFNFTRATDFSHEIRVFTPGDESSPVKLGDSIVSRDLNGISGRYKSWNGSEPSRLGISFPAINPTESEITKFAKENGINLREFNRYVVENQPALLLSTSAAVNDQFTNKYVAVSTRGGALQIFIPRTELTKLKRLPRNEKRQVQITRQRKQRTKSINRS